MAGAGAGDAASGGGGCGVSGESKIVFRSSEIVTVQEVREGEATLHEVVQVGVPDAIAYTDWSPDQASAEARLLLVAKVLVSHFIQAGNEPFLDHLISILPPPEPQTRQPAEAGECSAAGAATAGEIQAAQAGE